MSKQLARGITFGLAFSLPFWAILVTVLVVFW